MCMCGAVFFLGGGVERNIVSHIEVARDPWEGMGGSGMRERVNS